MAVHENRIKWLPLSVLQPGRVEALSSGQDSLRSARGGVGGGAAGEGAPVLLLEGIQVGADLGEDIVHGAFGIDLAYDATFLIKGDDRFRGLVVGL